MFGLSFSLALSHDSVTIPQNTDSNERVLDDAATSPEIQEVAVVLEGAIVLNEPLDLCTAFAHLFGLLYAMDIDYPKQMRCTFEGVQTIFFELSILPALQVSKKQNFCSEGKAGHTNFCSKVF